MDLQFLRRGLREYILNNRHTITRMWGTVIMDNLSCHHFEGGEVLEDIFNEMGIELLYTPIYSPVLNPAELVFFQS